MIHSSIFRQRRQAFIFFALTTLVSCTTNLPGANRPTDEVTFASLRATTDTITLANDLVSGYDEAFDLIRFERSVGNLDKTLNNITSDQDFLITNHIPSENPFWAIPVAQDGIAVVVHPDNPVQDLSISQLRDIFRGNIQNWNEVNGNDQPIQVLIREDGSATRAEFERMVMGYRRTTPNAQVYSSTASIITTLSKLENAIAYIPFSLINDRIKVLSVDSIVPSQETIGLNLYPLRSTIFLVSKQKPVGALLDFATWIQGPIGQSFVDEHFTPLQSR